jgi:hypothetical protein
MAPVKEGSVFYLCGLSIFDIKDRIMTKFSKNLRNRIIASATVTNSRYDIETAGEDISYLFFTTANNYPRMTQMVVMHEH